MTSIDALTKADFEGLVGQTLSVGGIELEIEAVRGGRPKPGIKREPFSVFLIAADPKNAPVFDDVVTVSHEALGEHALFVSRIVSPPDEAAYQIVFN